MAGLLPIPPGTVRLQGSGRSLDDPVRILIKVRREARINRLNVTAKLGLKRSDLIDSGRDFASSEQGSCQL